MFAVACACEDVCMKFCVVLLFSTDSAIIRFVVHSLLELQRWTGPNPQHLHVHPQDQGGAKVRSGQAQMSKHIASRRPQSLHPVIGARNAHVLPDEGDHYVHLSI